MNPGLFLVLVGALSSQLLVASDKPNQQEAINRLQQAVAKTNIFELPSFAMKATVQVELSGKSIDGSYQLLWNGPDQWREEIAFPGYSEVQIGGRGTIWVQRNPDSIPLPIYHLRQALPFGSNAAGASVRSMVRFDLSRSVVKKQRERKEHGNKLMCFELEDEDKHMSETCVNEGSGTIVNNSPFHVEDDLQPVAGRVFPRALSTVENGKTLAKADITELTAPRQFAPGTFTPPTGIPSQQGCMNPKPPYLAKRVSPEYPEEARLRRIQGTVELDVLIGIDGVPQIRRTIETPSADLAGSALHAVEKWHYAAATCNGQPVQILSLVRVNYALSHQALDAVPQ